MYVSILSIYIRLLNLQQLVSDKIKTKDLTTGLQLDFYTRLNIS